MGRWCQGRNTNLSGPMKALLAQLHKQSLQILEKGTGSEKRKKLWKCGYYCKREKHEGCEGQQRTFKGRQKKNMLTKEETSQNCFVSHLQNMDKKPGPSNEGVFQIRLCSHHCWSPRQKRTDKTMTLRWLTQIISVYPMLMSRHSWGLCKAFILQLFRAFWHFMSKKTYLAKHLLCAGKVFM